MVLLPPQNALTDGNYPPVFPVLALMTNCVPTLVPLFVFHTPLPPDERLSSLGET